MVSDSNRRLFLKTTRMKDFLFCRFGFAVGLLVALMSAGCNVLGPVGGLIGQAVPEKVSAEYAGLAHMKVAIMVWAESGVRTDFPYLQVDTAAGLQEKFKALQKSDNPKELEEATFPVRADTIARYQEDHPELEAMPITDLAAKFNVDAKSERVDRLIYVEVTDFSTRSEASLELYKGNITGSVKVIDLKDGKAKVVYTSADDIKATFPKDSPKEGMPDGTDAKIYQGTLDAFTTELSHRFYTYDKDPD
jgi:hypothetical protein